MGSGYNDAVQVQDRSGVLTMVTELHSAINILGKSIEELESRLGPALRPEPNAQDVAEKAAVRAASELTIDLERAVSTIYRHNQRIGNLLDHLDL